MKQPGKLSLESYARAGFWNRDQSRIGVLGLRGFQFQTPDRGLASRARLKPIRQKHSASWHRDRTGQLALTVDQSNEDLRQALERKSNWKIGSVQANRKSIP
jgi:hypothetical protein